MDRIISLLDKWKRQNAYSAKKESITLEILEATEMILQAGHISASDRTFWLDFLNTTKKPSFLN
jgi:hypothetical protein